MSEPSASQGPLSRETRERLERRVKDFERAWSEGLKPVIADCLAEVEAERLNLLAELVHADMECRWKVGEQLRVETYLERFPELARDNDLVVDLVLAEYRARQDRGEVPTPEEYIQRFPLLELELRPWLQGMQAEQAALPALVAVSTRHNLLDDEPHTVVRPESTWGRMVTPMRITIPGYEILSFLGRGGMGVVFKARDVRLKRIVALKMIPEGTFPTAEELGRFRREAESVARLQHLNIVQIYEIAEHHGRPFLSLEFVDGGNLVRKLVNGPQPPREAAQLIETLARSIHYAHQRGVVHRDLKPANVLLTSDGIPKITDFGLAKRMDADSTGTKSGAILGTPRYMAPEQASGRKAEVGPYTDVYSLGTILYELLAGKPPFDGISVLETLEQVRTQEPPPLKGLNLKIGRDLETICLSCLQKDPAKRYVTAEALADDLRAFLNGEPIRARRAGWRERFSSWTRRRPVEAFLLAVGSIALVGLVIGLWSQSFLAVSAVAVLGLLAGGSWYNVRLQAALTELAQQQQVSERHVERLHLMLDMTHRLMTAPDFASLLLVLTETTTRLLHADRATIYLVDTEAGEIWSKIALGENVGEIRIPIGIGIAGTVAVTGATVNLPDAYADPRFNPDIDRRTGYRTRNLLTLPIRARDGRAIGVYQVLNKKSGPFTQEDIDTLTALALTAAVAIEFAQRRGQGAASPSNASTRLRDVEKKDAQ